ncbi:TPA: hypothetical protein PXN90_004315 [Yersinia enterocolitica]|nr:hypothetical protein [Yersinia enterocolitica]
MNNIEEFESAYNTYVERDVGTPVEKFKHPVPGVTYKYQHANDMLAFWNAARAGLVAQLEAAQKRIKELESKVNHYVAAEYAHKHFDQTAEIIKRADSAELELVKVKAELSAASEKLKGEQEPIFLKQTGIGVNSCQGSYKEYVTIEESEYEENPTKHLKLFTAPRKPVVLLDKYVRNEKGQYILDGKCEPRIGFAVGWNAAIRAAGGKVEGGDNG